MEFHGFTNGLCIILGGIAASILLVAGVRKMFAKDILLRAHDITGNLLSVVGTLYAVLLGLIVVDALVRFEHAIDVVQEESNSLADIFLLAERLPAPERSRLQETCKAYAIQVVEDEWPLMATGHASMAARKTAFELAKSLDTFEPKTEAEKVVYPIILEQIRELWDCRRERVGTAEFGIPAVEWFVLIVGGAVTVLFAGLFRAESVSLQRFLTAMAALLIGLNLYLVSLFGYPFSGELTVSSRPFKVDIAIFEGRFRDIPLHENERPPE
ncbi:MAG: DUF4239 domain-containing protein [Planctomycetia bacterium]|nr:DUF4239 domain-containing protein [Planctomycetia bacterium]